MSVLYGLEYLKDLQDIFSSAVKAVGLAKFDYGGDGGRGYLSDCPFDSPYCFVIYVLMISGCRRCLINGDVSVKVVESDGLAVWEKFNVMIFSEGRKRG